jgi:hypothetical protein
VNWQHVKILAATNYFRERVARGAPDPRAKEVYEGLLDVLDPSRREALLKGEAAAKAAVATPPAKRSKSAKPARRRRARPAPPAKRPRR